MANQVTRNPETVVTRVVGNREAVAAELVDMNGAAVNLTGLTMVCRMVENTAGTVKLNNAAATIDVAADGKVSYTPAAIDVDTAGTYAVYFIDDATIDRRWPYDGPRFLLKLVAEWG